MARFLLLLGFCSLFSPLSERIRVSCKSLEEPGRGRWAPRRGLALGVGFQNWRLCDSVALDPGAPAVSCCGSHLVFHRHTQRCCSAHNGFFVIHRDPARTEAEDCRSYSGK